MVRLSVRQIRIAVYVMSTRIPSTLVSVLNGVVRVGTRIRAVVDQRNRIIKSNVSGEYQVPPATEVLVTAVQWAERYHCLDQGNNVVTKVVAPRHVTTRLPIRVVSRKGVRLVTVIVLIMVPILVRLVVLSLIPKGHVKATRNRIVNAVDNVYLRAVRRSLTVRRLAVPVLYQEFSSRPATMLRGVL